MGESTFFHFFTTRHILFMEMNEKKYATNYTHWFPKIKWFTRVVVSKCLTVNWKFIENKQRDNEKMHADLHTHKAHMLCSKVVKSNETEMGKTRWQTTK